MKKMGKFRITNENVSFYVDAIGVIVGAKEQEINDALMMQKWILVLIGVKIGSLQSGIV